MENRIARYLPNMQSYFDPPKSIDELRDAVAKPKKGYDIHHIVERGPAAADGFALSLIEAQENLVRIPRYRHWQISAWFQTENDAYGGLSPREYLRNKDWSERQRVGLRALVRHGVLKP